MTIVQIGPVFEVRDAFGLVVKRCLSRGEAEAFIESFTAQHAAA